MMGLEVKSDFAVCFMCGQAFGRRKGPFPVSYAVLYKGVGHTPICKACIETLFNSYLDECNRTDEAVRQVCRKLDIYWDRTLYDALIARASQRSIMLQYISKASGLAYAGKSYDDTLRKEGSLWSFDTNAVRSNVTSGVSTNDTDWNDLTMKWGSGYSASAYKDLEGRYAYWMSRLPDGMNDDVGADAIVRQLCALELDINRDRAAGKAVEKKVSLFNDMLGDLKLKPSQRKDDVDTVTANTPLGVWLLKYENERPLPEIDDDLKDVNGIRKYVFTWMGHLCKMLGVKNAYSKLYEDEISKLRVEKPEYDGDDEELMMESMDESGGDDDAGI